MECIRNFLYVNGYFFTQLDTTSIPCLNEAGETTATETDVVSAVYCVVNAEILEPFIWLLFPLGVVCLILGWLEPKKN